MTSGLPPFPGEGEGGAGSDAFQFGEEQVRKLLAENAALERTLQELSLGLDSHSIVATTDRRGYILQANDRFAEISKYSHEELIGAPQNIVNSGVHPKEFFREMWATIGRGRIWQGEICNRAKDGSKYWVATTIVPLLGDDGRPERYLSIRTDVTKLRLTEMRVRKLAYYDMLTGLPNRSFMVKHLNESVVGDGEEFQAYLTVGFEDLLVINDAFGYEMGDRTLRCIAQVLTDMVEVPDGPSSVGLVPQEVARVGSNAFGLHFAELGTARAEAEQRVQALSEPLIHNVNEAVRGCLGNVIEADLRVGYVLYRASDGLDGAQVFTRAEIARRRTVVTQLMTQPLAFDEQMVSETQERVTLMFDLRRGIERGDLRLYLQPIVCSDRSVGGFEALLRWQDPRRGLVLPGDFVPLAESTGLIVDIGAWVLDQACRTLADWAEDERTRDWFISVNVSEQQLRQRDFPETVRSALRRSGARAELLKLEVTETMIHRDVGRTVAMLHELRADKVEISLDDFGVGYSSLGYLKWLPVQTLKIDRTFITNVVNDPIDSAMVRAMVDMAHVMGVKVVAEGIETPAQFAKLKDFGADRFQGFLFGRPAPIRVEEFFSEA